MNNTDGFYTMKGYELLSDGKMSSAMEDYLEMIGRLMRENKEVRVNELSKMLHVRASSVTKMVQQLSQAGFIDAEKYGKITLTDKGREVSSYLLYRHDVINRFLCALNKTGDELEEAEKIEHFLREKTVLNLEKLAQRLEEK